MVLAAVPMADSNSGGGSGLAILLPLILIVGMIWFMSRSQRKQRARQADTVARLQPGTRVITTSGQVGVVDEVEDEYVVLEIAPDVYSRFVKQAVGRVLDSPETALGEPAADAAETADGTDTAAATDTADTADTTEAVADEVAEAPGADEPDRQDGVQDTPKADKSGDAAKSSLPPTHTEN